MIPAKYRDRKCSTCRHYQPSPLWRKGWCRNPLLYDRNTNHLVEADSLACNRTFIDYWEPATGPAQNVAPQARSSKPRIAPSIPMDTMDSKGERGVVTGNTPAAGMAAVAPKQTFRPTPAPTREPPQLSIVTQDYDPPAPMIVPERPGLDPKATNQVEELTGPGGEPVREDTPKTAAQRIRQARNQNRTAFLSTARGRVVMLLAVLAALAAIGGGALFYRNQQTIKAPTALPTASATRPPPTPTGLGDATATPLPVPTTVPAPAPPANVIAVNGWVQVNTNALNVRDAPSASGARLAMLPSGTKAHVIDGPKDADGFTWWKVDRFDPKDPAKAGWCAGKFLAPIPAP